MKWPGHIANGVRELGEAHFIIGKIEHLQDLVATLGSRLEI